MSSHRIESYQRAVRRRYVAVLLFAVWGCADDVSSATEPADANARVASLTVHDPAGALFAGDAVQLVASARDDAGRIIDRAAVSWSSSDAALARVDAGGRLVALGHGAVSVTAAAGRAKATASVSVRLTSEERRFAYVRVEDAAGDATVASGAPFQYNATGGNIRISHRGTGEYLVTFDRLAKVDARFRETVLVTPNGSGGERCLLNGWHNAPTGRDLDVSVSCFTLAGRRVDARFSLLVVGSGSLRSRLGFTVAGTAAESFRPEPWHTYASFADHVGITHSSEGSYLVQMRAPLDESPQNYFVSTLGGAEDLCKVSSWNRGVTASVICYAPTGALRDARFSLLMVENGRPGRRFGFAWANDPISPIGSTYVPNLRYQRTSSGDAVRIARVATGEYRVSFPGLTGVGNESETVHVSAYGGGLFSCQVAGWTNTAGGSALDATVRCWSVASGAPADTYFTILVLE